MFWRWKVQDQGAEDLFNGPFILCPYRLLLDAWECWRDLPRGRAPWDSTQKHTAPVESVSRGWPFLTSIPSCRPFLQTHQQWGWASTYAWKWHYQHLRGGLSDPLEAGAKASLGFQSQSTNTEKFSCATQLPGPLPTQVCSLSVGKGQYHSIAYLLFPSSSFSLKIVFCSPT